MTILGFIFVVALIGLALWAIFRFVPMVEPIKTFLLVAVIIMLGVWLLSLMGVLPSFVGAQSPKIH